MTNTTRISRPSPTPPTTAASAADRPTHAGTRASSSARARRLRRLPLPSSPTPSMATPAIFTAASSPRLLDEAMSKAVRAIGQSAMTRKMEVDYLRPVPSGVPLRIEGRVVRSEHASTWAEASILDAEGEMLAKANGLFIEILRKPKIARGGPTEPPRSTLTAIATDACNQCTMLIVSCVTVSNVVTDLALASNARCAMIRSENSVEMFTFDASSASSCIVPSPDVPDAPTMPCRWPAWWRNCRRPAIRSPCRLVTLAKRQLTHVLLLPFE